MSQTFCKDTAQRKLCQDGLFTSRQAESIVSLVGAMVTHISTGKDDHNPRGISLKASVELLRSESNSDICRLRAEANSDICRLRSEAMSDICRLRSEAMSDMCRLRNEQKSDIKSLKAQCWKMVLGLAVVAAGLVKLLDYLLPTI